MQAGNDLVNMPFFPSMPSLRLQNVSRKAATMGCRNLEIDTSESLITSQVGR